MRPGLVALVLVAAALEPVAAEPSWVLVLQAEGRADPGTRAKVDAAVLRLARGGTAQVAPGDISFADAAAAVGCMPEAPACQAEVIGMLAVDEIVYTTVTPTAGGVEIHVHRITAGGVARDARMTVPPGQSLDELTGIAPLFGGAPVAPEPPITAEPPAEPPPPPKAEPEPLPPASDPPAPVVATEPSPAYAQPDDITRPHVRRGPVIGMVAGGTMVIIGFVLWGQAADVRDQIEASPTSTLPQLQALAELEARGDGYAGWGNLMFIGGAVLGGVSTYYFLKDRKRARAMSARITPAVFDRGAGLTLTIGGSP